MSKTYLKKYSSHPGPITFIFTVALIKDTERIGDIYLMWKFHLVLKSCTVLVLRKAHRIWKETKLQPGTAGPGNMLGCCLVKFPFPVGHPEHDHCKGKLT